MSILITGGCGYIGSHTCIEMLKAGFDIVVIDNYYNAKPEALNRVKELAGRDFPFYECDIRDAEGLRKIFKAHDIEAVIHFAGLKAVGESVDSVFLLRHRVRYEQSLSPQRGYAHRRGDKPLWPHQIHHRGNPAGHLCVRPGVERRSAAVFQSHRRP